MDRLLHFTDDDPAVRAEATPSVEPAALGLRRDGRWAVAFVRPTHTHGISLMLRGDDTLLRELVRSSPFASWSDRARAKGANAVTLPRTAEDSGSQQPTARRSPSSSRTPTHRCPGRAKG